MRRKKKLNRKDNVNKDPVIENKYQYKTLNGGQHGWNAENTGMWGKMRLN